MADNDGSKNSEKENRENKEDRRFSLKLVFIVIIGLSISVFILQFRRAKNSAIEIQRKRSDQSRVTNKKNESPGLKRLKPADARVPSNKSLGAIARKRILPARGRKGTVSFVGSHQFKLKAKAIKLGSRQRYQELAEYVAVDSALRDRFDTSSIILEKFNRIFVESSETKGLAVERIVRNMRTGSLGVVTGTLVVQFKSQDFFKERSDFLPTGYSERNTFAAINTTIWGSSDMLNLSELEELKTKLEKDSKIKSVRIEILEHEKVAK